MIARTLTAASLRVGEAMPALERQLTQMRMVAYAGATWDWHRLHYENAYVAERNIRAPVVDGQMFGALIAEALSDWLGPQAFIRKLNFRLRAMVFAGETVRCDGDISAITSDPDNGHSIVAVSHRVCVDQRLVADGTAQVQLPD